MRHWFFFLIYLKWMLTSILNIFHHYQGVQTKWIPLHPSSCPSLLIITVSKSSSRHQVSTESWWMWVFAGQPTLVCPCVGVHRRLSLMSSCLHFQQYPKYLAYFFFGWFVRWEVSIRTTEGTASRTCWK